MKEMLRITFCLTVVCLFAGMVLGIGFYFSEPARIKQTAASETAIIRKLLDMGDDGEIVEVRRYLNEDGIGYLMPSELKIFDMSGKPIKTITVPAKIGSASVEEKDKWAATELAGGELSGRFFMGNTKGERIGYVTEANQYGFKSNIRFFVALTPDFRIRGVEILSHEEDPGLGAEITRPVFKDQFAGRTANAVEGLTVSKDPIPNGWKAIVLDRAKMSFAQWSEAHGKEIEDSQDDPIYAVTGATISSRALTDGVKRAVSHLQYRLGIATEGTK